MSRVPPCRPGLPFVSPELFIAAFFFAAGICSAQVQDPVPSFLHYGILLLLAFLLVLHKLRLKFHKAFCRFILALLFFLLGLHNAATFSGPPTNPSHIYNLVDRQQTLLLEGTLHEYPAVLDDSSTGPKTRLLVAVKRIYRPGGVDPAPQGFFNASGLVLLTLKGTVPQGLIPGSALLARANVSRVSTYSTPGAFNYKKHLASRNIFIRGWIRSPGNLAQLYRAGSPALSLRYLPERIRHGIAVFLDRTLSQPARGLYKAILIGDRSDVPSDVLENFTGAGCIHILAISGMHMGLLALLMIGLATWALKRSEWLLLHAPVLKIAAAAALLPLLCYSLIAGFNIPVQRALFMTLVFIVATLFDMPRNIINHILLAALLILAWKPESILAASFQLSFAAVFAIAIIYPLLSHFLLEKVAFAPSPAQLADPVPESVAASVFTAPASFFLKWLTAGIVFTGAAMLGTFPLLLFHFNRFSPVAPISNLLVEPLICFWALVTGLVASLCIPLLPALAKILFAAGSWGLLLAERICAFFASLPRSSLWLPTLSSVEILLVYCILAGTVSSLYLSGGKRRQAMGLTLVSLFSLVAAVTASTVARQTSGSATITFLDVGHGSSTLLQLPGGKNILIDGGGSESDRFNIGERVIGPFLWHRKIRRLDAVVLTHPHADHFNGLPFILARFHPRVVWLNGGRGQDRKYRELLELAGQMGIETRVARAGSILLQNGTSRISCISSGPGPPLPAKGARPGASPNPNDHSIILRLDTGGRSFLFPGDISAAKAEMLSGAGLALQADVLLAPHHGSAGSMSRKFIETVAPRYVAISAGRSSRYDFPAQSFYDLRHDGIEVLSTNRDGTISFSVKNGTITPGRYQVN